MFRIIARGPTPSAANGRVGQANIRAAWRQGRRGGFPVAQNDRPGPKNRHRTPLEQIQRWDGLAAVRCQPSAFSYQRSAKASCREEAQKAQDGLRLLCLFAAKVVWLIADG